MQPQRYTGEILVGDGQQDVSAVADDARKLAASYQAASFL